MSDWAVLLEGTVEGALDGLTEGKIAQAARRAINDVARSGRARAAKRIRREVDFPSSYVTPAQKRLYVSKQAKGRDLEAKITAQARNTSLARFAVGTPKIGQAGVAVKVQPGRVRMMKRAFLIKLPQGTSPITDTKFNLGLAIRLKPGETLTNKKTARRVANGLYVLYGPSVDQVFRAVDGSGVATDIIPDLQDELQAEFLRQLRL